MDSLVISSSHQELLSTPVQSIIHSPLDRRSLARRHTMGENEHVLMDHMLREKARNDILVDLCQAMQRSSVEKEKPQQIIINNVSASQSRGEDSKRLKQDDRSSLVVWAEFGKTFFQSGFNRVCFFGTAGMGLYLAYGYLSHKWEMEAMQKRIDANLLLRASQWMFDERGARVAEKTSGKILGIF